MAIIQLNAEHSIWQGFEYRTLGLDQIFSCHS